MPNSWSRSVIVLFGPPNVTTDIYWKTGFWATDPVICIDFPGKKTFLFVGKMEHQRALEECKEEISVYPAYQLNDILTTIQPMLNRVKPDTHCVTTTNSLQHPLFERLRDMGLPMIIVGFAYPERIMKSPEEIQWIRKNQGITRDAMAFAVQIITEADIYFGKLRHKGKALTSQDVRRMIRVFLADKGYTTPADSIAASGTYTAIPHDNGKSRQLFAHLPIILDIFPQSLENHYWADMTRTVVKGEPTQRLSTIHEIVEAGYCAALEKVRAGVNILEVNREIAEFFENQGFGRSWSLKENTGFVHGLGHRIGIDIHENPTFGDEPILQIGDVITIEPGLYYPDIGGVRIEDTIVVTENGYELFAPYPTELLEL